MHFIIAWSLLNISKWAVCFHHQSPTGHLSVASAPRLEQQVLWYDMVSLCTKLEVRKFNRSTDVVW